MAADDSTEADTPDPADVDVPSPDAAPELDPVLLYAHQWKRRVPLAIASGAALVWVMVVLISLSQKRLENTYQRFQAEVDRRGYGIARNEDGTSQSRFLVGIAPQLDAYEWALRRGISNPRKSPLSLVQVSRIHAAIAAYEVKAAAIQQIETLDLHGGMSWRFSWSFRQWLDRFRFYEVLLVKWGTPEQIDRHLARLGHVVTLLAQQDSSPDMMDACMAVRLRQTELIERVVRGRQMDVEARWLERWVAWTEWPFPDGLNPNLPREWLLSSVDALGGERAVSRSQAQVLSDWPLMFSGPPDLTASLTVLQDAPRRINDILAGTPRTRSPKADEDEDDETSRSWQFGANKWYYGGMPEHNVGELLWKVRAFIHTCRLRGLMCRALIYRAKHGGVWPTTAADLGEDVAAWRDVYDPAGGPYRMLQDPDKGVVWMVYSVGFEGLDDGVSEGESLRFRSVMPVASTADVRPSTDAATADDPIWENLP